MPELWSYLPLLLATVAVELGVALALSPRERRGPVAFTSVSLNLVTHPLATIAMAAFAPPFLVVEGVVFVVEALGLEGIARLRAWRAGCIALLANGVTTLVGVWWWA